MTKPLWPHQERGIEEIKKLILAGEKRNCLTSPTGGGKSRIIEELILWGVKQGWQVSLYTHRQLLRDQISRSLHTSGIDHGMNASGFAQEPWKNVHVCMSQTVMSRLRNGGELHDSQLVIVDECHDQSRGGCEGLLNKHIEAGAALVGVTATPLDIGHLYQNLVVAGLNSELRDCGAHVWCRCFEPTVPDIHRELRRMKTGEFQQGDVVKAVMTPVIFGHVLTHWKKLNPYARPTILFAPGVKESIWFMDQFKRVGVKAAHICGESVIVDGEEMKSNRETRQQVLEDVAKGEIKVVCNRFVLREGVDSPSLYHGILATCMGSPVSFLQSVGRILRSHPSLDHVILQDHGGNVHRHGSPNENREWDMGKTASEVCSERKQKLEENPDLQPIVCPECGHIRKGGPQCPSCLFQHTKSIRRVIQLDGSLVEVSEGSKKKAKPPESDEAMWKKLYYVGKHKGWTFNKAAAIFKKERGRWPAGIGLTPKSKDDWCREIGSLSYGSMH